jgi:hypothetical protein
MFLNIIKVIYDKPIASIKLNGKQLKPFLPKSGTRQVWLLSLFLFSIVLEFLARAVRQEQKMKRISNREGRSQNIPIYRRHDPIPKRP